MQKWGDYLALRARIREIYLAKNPKKPDPSPFQVQGPRITDGFVMFENDIDAASVDVIIKATEKITSNPNLKQMHELARASLRAFQYRVTPHRQFEYLSDRLNDYRADPAQDDTLGDWRRLGNNLLLGNLAQDEQAQQSQVKHPWAIKNMRAKYGYFDWISTLQACPATTINEQQVACKTQADYAIAQWKKAQAQKNLPEARVWLVAALITANHSNEEMELHAAKVPESAPEYITVRYNLARLLRLAGKHDKAKTLLDAELKKSFTSQSALNLFLRERFAVANSLAQASQYLFSNVIGQYNPDTKESTFSTMTKMDVGENIYWLYQGLSINDLLALSGNPALPNQLRTNVAMMAWLRAELLNKDKLANKSAKTVQQLWPVMQAPVDQYLRASKPIQRRHILLVLFDSMALAPTLPVELNQVSCCKTSGGKMSREITQPPGYWAASPEVSTEPKVRDAEVAQLLKIKLTKHHFAQHLLVYAAAYPNDQELPALLAKVIHSNKYSPACSEEQPGCKTAFRQCFELLHRKYGKTKAAKNTPYWY